MDYRDFFDACLAAVSDGIKQPVPIGLGKIAGRSDALGAVYFRWDERTEKHIADRITISEAHAKDCYADYCNGTEDGGRAKTLAYLILFENALTSDLYSKDAKAENLGHNFAVLTVPENFSEEIAINALRRLAEYGDQATSGGSGDGDPEPRTPKEYFDKALSEALQDIGRRTPLVPVVMGEIPESEDALSATYFRWDKASGIHVADRVVISEALVKSYFHDGRSDRDGGAGPRDLKGTIGHEMAHALDRYSKEAKAENPGRDFAMVTTPDHFSPERSREAQRTVARLAGPIAEGSRRLNYDLGDYKRTSPLRRMNPLELDRPEEDASGEWQADKNKRDKGAKKPTKEGLQQIRKFLGDLPPLAIERVADLIWEITDKTDFGLPIGTDLRALLDDTLEKRPWIRLSDQERADWVERQRGKTTLGRCHLFRDQDGKHTFAFISLRTDYVASCALGNYKFVAIDGYRILPGLDHRMALTMAIVHLITHTHTYSPEGGQPSDC